MNDEWGQKLYDDMITNQRNYNRDMRQALSPMSTPESLPEPGVEVEKGEFSNYRVRLTVEISPELIAATKAQDRPVMIQVALSEAVKKAARQIIGKIAMERLKKSYKDNNSRQDSEQYTTWASQEYPLNSPKKVHKKP